MSPIPPAICGIFERHGWCRMFGVGIAWVPETHPPMFSQRNGFTKTLTLFGYRFHWLAFNSP